MYIELRLSEPLSQSGGIARWHMDTPYKPQHQADVQQGCELFSASEVVGLGYTWAFLSGVHSEVLEVGAGRGWETLRSGCRRGLLLLRQVMEGECLWRWKSNILPTSRIEF